jgi:5-oxoprolinase (ATP-hydrolysing)/N-methylhydantoinase A
MRSTCRIGVDIGGTFTDFVLLDESDSRIRLYKHLTTPDDPAIGALAGLAELVEAEGIDLGEVREIVHGTTLVTNALIERRGATLGLLTTAGMRDVLELGVEQRYDIYDLFLTFPTPLVPRRRRLEIPERMSRDGAILTPLDEGAVARATRALVTQGAQAIAICFLHAYRNPAHERRAAEIVHELYPDLVVSLSSEVVPELREYPRFVTTCANAYVQPLVDRYIRRLEGELRARGFTGPLRLMHSAGGLISTVAARAFPIRLLESGPAGGALATAFFGQLAGKTDVISFDMGGTTAKACLIENGRPDIAPAMEAARVHRFKKGSGLPIKAPVIDMIEIGAGGGSIVAINEVGLLTVGPRSAGADPGPACYGQGGTLPTVTDANLVLGFYDPDFFLGGRMSLNKDAAVRALEAVAKPLNLSTLDAAWGVHRLVTEGMAAAARVHLVEKDKDPRRYAMVGFGGAGPAHAAEVARLLGVTEVIVPPASGAASALGFLAAPLSFEQSRSHPVILVDPFDGASVDAVLRDLEAACREHLAEAGVRPDAIATERSADMRLVRQMHEITVPLPDGPISQASLAAIRAGFEKAYAARHTSLYRQAEIEVISFRVRCSGPVPRLSVVQKSGGDVGSARKGTRRAYFGAGLVDAAVYDRYALSPGFRIEGPAFVEEREATTVVPPGDTAQIDDIGNIRIAVAAPAQAEVVVARGDALEEAIRRIEADPVALEIMWSRLINVTEEMWSTVVRTAFSLTMSESQDFACELLDPTGEALAHSPQAMPVFNLTLPRAVKELLKVFPPQTLKSGDILVTNDPWIGVGHLYDFIIVTPIFRDDFLVALAGSIGHVTDIGGTKNALGARELYDEGLQVPPMKLFKAGVENEDLVRIMRENVRDPDQVLGDVHALVEANARGAERLLRFMDEYGMHDLSAIAAVVQKRAETAMRDAVSAFPDGVYRSEIYSNPLGDPLRLPLCVTVSGEAMTLDFDGAPAQLPQGGLNVVYNYTAAYATFPLKCMLSPNVKGNAGDYRPFTVTIPEGSLLNCVRPASVGIRQRNGWYVANCVLNALAAGAPEVAKAFSGLPFIVNWYGKERDGRVLSDMIFSGGGEGGSARGDGKSGLIWPTSAANTSIEMFENRMPVLVLEKTFAPDSGGPGQFRGGLGARLRFRKLADDGIEMQAAVYPEGVGVPQAGMFGGLSGATASGRVRAKGKTEPCGAGRMVSLASTAEIIEIQIAGGSGYGEPHRRAAGLIEADIADGYVTRDGAARDYGYTAPENDPLPRISVPAENT